MANLCKCTNEKCKDKLLCKRYTCIPSEYQYYWDFNENDCDYFINNK